MKSTRALQRRVMKKKSLLDTPFCGMWAEEAKALGKNNSVRCCGAGLWPALHHAGGTPAPQYESEPLIS